MSKYFHLSQGLRGCYMPDSASVIRVETRRELKEAIEYEARTLRDSDYVGLSQKAVASFVAVSWREAQKARPASLPYALAYGEKGRAQAFGIFLSVATREDWKEHKASED